MTPAILVVTGASQRKDCCGPRSTTSQEIDAVADALAVQVETIRAERLRGRT